LYGGPGTGIGPALRKARQTRGKSIEEASRDTRIRPEYLQALEREAFGSLRGDVYVRGFLRSYSTYLGLNPDKVVSVYVRSTGRKVADVPEPPPVRPLRQAALRKVLHRRGNWSLALGVAVVGLVAAGAFGILSRGGTAPAPAGLSASLQAAPAAPPVRTVVAARKPVHLTVVVDGQTAFSGPIGAGTTKLFEGTDLIQVKLDSGETAELTVNGHDVGEPGISGKPYTASFQAQDFRRQASPGSSGG
jgi:hypothetical protein